jgi:hypothetical protein
MKAASTGAAVLLTPAWANSKRPLGIDPEWDGITNPHPELKKLGDKFTFAIIADSQVGHADGQGLSKTVKQNLIDTIEELNTHKPEVKFTVHLGDLVNVPDVKSFDNWFERVSEFKNPHVTVHGNHDTIPPYTRFRDYQEKLNGIRSVYYSFDAGKWHFVVMPANTEFGNYDNLEVTGPMLQWLRKDLERNRHRPTVILMHLHFMPQGLSQLEWYSHSQQLKRELLDIFTRYGNVKYYFNGHVHNGIKVTMKTAWTYKGINFMTLPSGTAPRPFGEEYPEFIDGLDKGGYYSIIDINGDKLTVKSRLSGVDAEFIYPQRFKEFSEAKDLRCLTRAIDLPSNPALVNGNFEDSIKGWYYPYRYICDKEAGFQNEWRMKHRLDGRHAAYVYAKPMGKHWLQDEYNEFYQIVDAPKTSPVFEASYLIEKKPERGGGYLRLIAIGGPENRGEFKFMMEFDFGDADVRADSDYYPRALGYHIRGKVSSWLYMQNIGRQKNGLYFDIPQEKGKWHTLTANIEELYDNAMGKKGAYRKLGVNRFLTAAGVWSIKDVETGSGAFFDSISLLSADKPSAVNGQPIEVTENVFKTNFGQSLQDRVKRGKG